MRTVVDKHCCFGYYAWRGGFLRLTYWCFMRTVADNQYRGGLLCLMWWFIMLDVVGFYAYCGGTFAYVGGYAILWWVIMLGVVGFSRTAVD